MSYEPRGTVKKLMDAMQRAGDPQRVWTCDEAAKAMGVPKKGIAARLRCAVNAGLLQVHHRSPRRIEGYSLEAAAEEAEAFSAQLWNDGDLVLAGVEIGDDGRVLIKCDQVAQVKRLLTGQIAP
jgi:hypothetical protein